MIDCIESRKNKVIVQWVSNEFIKKKMDLIKNSGFNDSECYLYLEDGKVILDRAGENISIPKGKEPGILNQHSYQIFTFNTSVFDLSLPVSAHTKDLGTVKLKVDTKVQIDSFSKHLRYAMRLISEEAPVSEPFNSASYREFSKDDLIPLISRKITYILETEYIGSRYSAELESADDAPQFTDMISILNSNAGYWENFGLKVEFQNISILKDEKLMLENQIKSARYESIKNERELLELNQKKSQLFEKNKIDAEYVRKMKVLEEEEKANLELEKKKIDINYEKTLTLIKEEASVEIERSKLEMYHDLDKMKKLHQAELDRMENENLINNEKAKEEALRIQKRIKDIESEILELDRDNKFKDELKNIELENIRKNFELDHDAKEAEILVKANKDLMIWTVPEFLKNYPKSNGNKTCRNCNGSVRSTAQMCRHCGQYL